MIQRTASSPPAGEGYRDVTVTIDPAGDERYLVRVACEGSSQSATIAWPEDMRELRAALIAATHPRDICPNDNGTAAVAPTLELMKSYGERLFRLVFDGELLAFYRTLEASLEVGESIRFRLIVQSPCLTQERWETLYDAKVVAAPSADPTIPPARKGSFFCLGNSLLRHIELADEVKSISVELPLRVLGMVALPNDQQGLKADEEKQRIENALQPLMSERLLELNWVQGESYRDLRREITNSDWHVFHFIGHGQYAAEKQQGVIMLSDGGKSQPVTADQLAKLLATPNRALRLAVLNSCEGALGNENDLFSSTATTLVQSGIPSVVSMQSVISDGAAISFATDLYTNVAQGRPIDSAIAEARLMLACGDSHEWATPVVHMRAKCGRLFEIGLKESVNSTEPARARVQRSTADPGATGSATPPPQSPRSRASERSSAGLIRLIQRMQHDWIDGFLAERVYDSDVLNLRMELLSDVVDSGFPISDSGNPYLPEGTPLQQVFEDQGGALLILGTPGSGKSTVLLGLMRDQLALAAADSAAPIPLFLSLSRWTVDEGPIDKWIVDELCKLRLARTPRKQFTAWLQEGRITLLLDGLDEVARSLRVECVRALNEFLDDYVDTQIAVCCRLGDYLEVGRHARLNLNAAISLAELTRGEVQAFFEQRQGFSGMSEALCRSAPLARTLQNPFSLGYAAWIYKESSAQEICDDFPFDANSDQVREMLITRLVDRRFERSRA